MLILIAAKVYGKELPEFYRGVRAMGMGNAFTAISDDEDAVFYNPAGLAFNNRMKVVIWNPKLEISRDDLKAIGAIREIAKAFDAVAISKIFGKNIYLSGTLFPSFYLPNFVIGYYLGANAHFVSRNLSLPTVEITYLIDHGIVTGFGYETRGFSKRHFLRTGFMTKLITRQGLDRKIPISTLATADKTFLSSLKASPAPGVGINLGFQYEFPISVQSDIILGSSWLDIGDTSFGGRLGTKRPPPIRNNLTAGGALVTYFGVNRWKTNRSNFKITAEGRHLNEKGKDPRLLAHVGVELQLSNLISVQLGWSQDDWTAGAKVNLWLVDVSAVTYSTENQALAFQDRERRYMVQFTTSFDLLGDAFPTDRYKYRRMRPRTY